MGRFPAILLILALLAPLSARAAGPERVVSIHLCADQFALQLAPEKLVSVSFLAADKALSSAADQINGRPLNRGTVEEILGLKPDLVLTGKYSSAAVKDSLRRLGIAYAEVGVPGTLDDVAAETLAVGRALGVPERAEARVAQFRQAMAALPEPAYRPLAAVYQANGLTQGAHTLMDEVLTRAGYENLAARMGLSGYTALPLERLVAGSPEMLLVAFDSRGGPSLAQAGLTHPALQRLFSHAARFAFSRPFLNCPTPDLAEAVRELAAARGGMGGRS